MTWRCGKTAGRLFKCVVRGQVECYECVFVMVMGHARVMRMYNSPTHLLEP